MTANSPLAHEIPLNGADGLDHAALANCGDFYSVPAQDQRLHLRRGPLRFGPRSQIDKPSGITLLIRMATISLKLSPSEVRKLNRSARANRQTKSAYIRSLITGRIDTTDDWLRAWESGRLDPLSLRRRSRRRASA